MPSIPPDNRDHRQRQHRPRPRRHRLGIWILFIALLTTSVSFQICWSTHHVVSVVNEAGNGQLQDFLPESPPARFSNRRNDTSHPQHQYHHLHPRRPTLDEVYAKVLVDLQEQMGLLDVLPPTMNAAAMADRVSSPLPRMEQIAGPDTVVSWEPMWGRHQSTNDVIMGVAQSSTYDQLVLFVETLGTHNYTGDLVLCVDFSPEWLHVVMDHDDDDPNEGKHLHQHHIATKVWLTEYIPTKYPKMNVVLYQTRYEPSPIDNPFGRPTKQNRTSMHGQPPKPSPPPPGSSLQRTEQHYQPPDKHRMMGTAKLYRKQTATSTMATSGMLAKDGSSLTTTTNPPPPTSATSTSSSTSGELFDPRNVRSFVQMRFEFMAYWIRFYPTTSRVGIFDIHDVHFQRHPFEGGRKKKRMALPLTPLDWHFAQEFGSKLGATAPWVKWSWGQKMLDTLHSNPPINPGTMVGGRLAAEVYLRAIIQYLDNLGGVSRGWGEDQAHTTVMAYTKYLVNHTKVQFHLHKQFSRDNPFTFLGTSARRAAKHAKRPMVNDRGEAVNGPAGNLVVVPIVHKGVPDPCHAAEQQRLRWMDEFEEYYQQNVLSAKNDEGTTMMKQ